MYTFGLPKKLKALEKRVQKQLQAEAIAEPEPRFLNELTAEELITVFETTGEIPITASKGFQISNEVKQKVYGINNCTDKFFDELNSVFTQFK